MRCLFTHYWSISVHLFAFCTLLQILNGLISAWKRGLSWLNRYFIWLCCSGRSFFIGGGADLNGHFARLFNSWILSLSRRSFWGFSYQSSLSWERTIFKVLDWILNLSTFIKLSYGSNEAVLELLAAPSYLFFIWLDVCFISQAWKILSNHHRSLEDLRKVFLSDQKETSLVTLVSRASSRCFELNFTLQMSLIDTRNAPFFRFWLVSSYFITR